MKISICDVCYKDNNKIERAIYRIGKRNRLGVSLRIDACEKHKSFCNDISFEELSKWVYGKEGIEIEEYNEVD